MLKSKSSVALCIVAGSFFLYCGESAMNKIVAGDSRGDASFVNDAKAQETCNSTCSAPKFTKIWEGDFTEATVSTPSLALGNYRQVAFYWGKDVNADPNIVCRSMAQVGFRLDASMPYGESYSFSGERSGVSKFDVEGPDMIVSTPAVPPYPGGKCLNWKRHLVIAGVL